jgi:hypothetical protein
MKFAVNFTNVYADVCCALAPFVYKCAAIAGSSTAKNRLRPFPLRTESKNCMGVTHCKEETIKLV